MSSLRPIGPRACSFCVEMPTSAPRPNSPPSVNRVEAFTATTAESTAAQRFTAQVDAAAVLVNASSRFVDGGELGFGAEIGISTQKLHARGPMALRELTTAKYIVRGTGQTRG